MAEPEAAGAAAPTVVSLTGVSVVYRMPSEHIRNFKDFAIRWVQRKVAYDEFWALRDINIDVRRHEVLGIIGANGAGKSTLLKVIARVQHPTAGRVQIRGRVAPLLELGAGFDFELTGRENVYLNGTLLGFRISEIAQRFDRIVDYAGLREFIDRPMRTYSSGMIVRLGFAIATDTQPDILILDEVLAVGDADFQKKSNERIRELRDKSEAVIMVSHDLRIVGEMCQRVAWLDHGTLRAIGPAADVIAQYKASVGS
jgi:ABC-2 type transport system ATP-binding protein/lipopolysaccharide transport system ATP-binding protein